MKTDIVGFKSFTKGLHPLFFLFILLHSRPASCQVNYRESFGNDYQWAINTIDNNTWWSDTLTKHGIDAHFALAVIFPELIRYSSIRDYMEVKALEVLYVQYGNDYADFSVGYFQMKPSFAEQIESDILRLYLTQKIPGLALLNPDTMNSTGTRKARILRLKDEYYQLLYLEAFFRIIEQLYPEISHSTLNEKLLFYATAYNAGYRKGKVNIRSEMRNKHFYTGMIHSGAKYSYSAISLDYFLNYMNR